METIFKSNKTVVLPSLIAIVLSGFIGMLVALPFIIDQPDIVGGLIKSCLVGVTISVFCTLDFIFICWNIRRWTLWSFLSVALIIAAGTTGGALFFGFEAIPILMMVALAEITGMALTYAMYRYSNRLNDKLVKTQKRLKTK